MNKLNVDITDTVVVLSPKFYKGDERARRFLCKGGFGCRPDSNGQAVFGTFLIDGEECRIEGGHIEKLSDDQSTEVEQNAAPPQET
jgi:hypothetical protein